MQFVFFFACGGAPSLAFDSLDHIRTYLPQKSITSYFVFEFCDGRNVNIRWHRGRRSMCVLVLSDLVGESENVSSNKCISMVFLCLHKILAVCRFVPP